MYRIAQLRAERNMRQIELAQRAGISQPFLHDLEYGMRGASHDTLKKIANALECTIEDLKGEPDRTAV